MTELNPHEREQRAKIAELEFPRLVSHADGTQTRVENAKEAEAAFAKGATLLPTAAVPSPADGGTPNADQVVIVAAIGPSRATVAVVPAVKAATDKAAKAADEDEPDHKADTVMADILSPQEQDARATVAALEFPRMVNHANGTQSRVENLQAARAAIAKGATLTPTAPSPDDGGVPNHPQVVRVLGVVVSADAGSLTLTGLEPDTAVIGAADFVLHVMGTGFLQGSVIVFAGQEEPTTVVSPHEVTTGVNMTVWLGADPAIPVLVKTPDGQVSNTLLFAFTAAGTRDTADDAEPTPKARKK